MAKRTYDLQPNEMETQRALDEERTALLARFGALTLDMENARQQIAQMENRRRTFLDAVAARCGIREYKWMQMNRGTLEADVVEQPESAATLPIDIDAEPRIGANGRR